MLVMLALTVTAMAVSWSRGQEKRHLSKSIYLTMGGIENGCKYAPAQREDPFHQLGRTAVLLARPPRRHAGIAVMRGEYIGHAPDFRAQRTEDERFPRGNVSRRHAHVHGFVRFLRARYRRGEALVLELPILCEEEGRAQVRRN